MIIKVNTPVWECLLKQTGFCEWTIKDTPTTERSTYYNSIWWVEDPNQVEPIILNAEMPKRNTP